MTLDIGDERVLVLSAGPANESWEDHPRRLLLRSAVDDGLAATLVDDPADATVILYATVAYGGLWMRNLLRHPLTRRYPEKVFVYSEADCPWPRLRGIYTSMPTTLYDRRRHRAGPYLPFHHESGLGSAIRTITPIERPRWLWSFVGAVASAPRLRAAVIALDDDRALVLDTSAQRWTPFYGPAAQRIPIFKRYVESLQDSAFAVCPRGAGTSTMRLFEALAAGRVPVVIADRWVEPDGPDWSSCSLRIRECDVATVPRMLREFETSASAMGAAARAAYQQWFGDSVLYRRTVEACVAIVRHAPPETAPGRRVWSLRSLTRGTTWRHLWAEARDPIRPNLLND